MGSDYSASVLPFLLFPVPPHSCFPSARLRSRFSRFPRSLPPDFSCVPSRFSYSALLFVSFHSTLLRSHSRSTGAYHPFSLPVFSASHPHPFVRFRSTSSYSAFAFSFPFFPLSPGVVPAVPVYPRSFQPVAMLIFPVWYSACCNSFLLDSASPHSGYRIPLAFPYGFRPLPHSKHLRFWILGRAIHPEN